MKTNLSSPSYTDPIIPFFSPITDFLPLPFITLPGGRTLYDPWVFGGTHLEKERNIILAKLNIIQYTYTYKVKMDSYGFIHYHLLKTVTPKDI